MNAKIRQMMDEIQRRGGKLHISGGLPDEVTEQFLEEVLACPLCTNADDAPPADPLFKTAFPTVKRMRRRKGGH